MTKPTPFPAIVRKKNWEIFLLFLAFLFMSFIIDTFVLLYNVNQWWLEFASTIIPLGFFLPYPLLVWSALQKLLADQVKFEKTPTKTVFAAVCIMLSIALILVAGLFIEIPFLNPALAVAFLICAVFIASLPARQLKSIQLKRNAGIWEYTPEIFLFFFWPLCVWRLQPEINDLVEMRIVIEE